VFGGCRDGVLLWLCDVAAVSETEEIPVVDLRIEDECRNLYMESVIAIGKKSVADVFSLGGANPVGGWTW
jgi:hypothetical protein